MFKNYTNHMSRDINLNFKRLLKIGKTKDRCLTKGLFEALEMLLSHESPKKSGLIGKMMKGIRQMREVRNGFTINIDDTKKNLKGRRRLRNSPFC